MAFVPFELERWQSEWEHRVRHNLSESGVHPLTVEELLQLSDTDPAVLLGIELGYSQTNGSDALRSIIASHYPGATPDNVVVTVGSSEANFLCCWTLIGPGDHVAIQVPTYMQTWGLAHNFGADVTTFRLSRDDMWRLDTDTVDRAITSQTGLVVVTNPNNPTGHVLTADERGRIVERVTAAGAWLLADEVYRGAERNETLTETFWGTSDRTVVTGGLSKAYGLPGLRIGWLVGPTSFVRAVLERHDYTVIGPSAVSDVLAQRALAVRDALFQRTRTILNANYGRLERWLTSFGSFFDWAPPAAGAICLARYRSDLRALDLVEHLRARHDTLLVPGEHFEMPQHLRLGYGARADQLDAALDATARGLRDLISD